MGVTFLRHLHAQGHTITPQVRERKWPSSHLMKRNVRQSNQPPDPSGPWAATNKLAPPPH